MKKTSLKQTMDAIYRLEATQNFKCTMLGIGPMSATLIEAVFMLAKRKDFPVLFIASRNQVDADELGGGYVCGWNQETFRKDIDDIAKKCGFNGLYYLCRDHGGPWQRDQERKDKLPAEKAMELGKISYLYDLKSGFDLLHIDPTKIPTDTDTVPMELVLDYTVELIEYCETQRLLLGLPEVAYEVGTEETNGGLTEIAEYSRFIDILVERLKAKKLPLPVYIVGNTGTLTRLTENIGKYSSEQAMALSKAARVHGVGLKEHNGDYLSDFILHLHPATGVTATNVAPEYGVAETRAMLLLSDIETYLVEKGLLHQCSNFRNVFTKAAIRSERWRKWMVGSQCDYSIEQVLENRELAEQVVQICGHYAFNEESVKEEKAVLYRNLQSAGLNPERVVLNAVMGSIERYINAFELEGSTTKIMSCVK